MGLTFGTDTGRGIGTPAPWPTGDAQITYFDVSPDGERILTIESAKPESRIHVVGSERRDFVDEVSLNHGSRRACGRTQSVSLATCVVAGV